MIDIREISFEDIGPIWADELWPGRELLEPVSAMLFNGGHDMTHFELPVRYIGVFEKDSIVAVNSGHMCADNSYRSRGLWVNPTARGRGYGVELLRTTITDGLLMGCSFCWSLPRKTSWVTYAMAGFKLTSDWGPSDTSEANAYCRFNY